MAGLWNLVARGLSVATKITYSAAPLHWNRHLTGIQHSTSAPSSLARMGESMHAQPPQPVWCHNLRRPSNPSLEAAIGERRQEPRVVQAPRGNESHTTRTATNYLPGFRTTHSSPRSSSAYFDMSAEKVPFLFIHRATMSNLSDTRI